MGTPDSGSAQRASSGVPVKPEDSESIDPTWLADFDTHRTEYLQRLDTDRSIVDELRRAGFAGKNYTYFETELAKYGIAVMTAWIRTHQVFTKARARGVGGLPMPIDDALHDHDTASSLAGETVATALVNFREYVLIPGRWTPEKGASIRTYFIGQCLLRFANIYRAWFKSSYYPDGWGHQVELEIDEHGSPYEHVETATEQKVAVDALLARVKNPQVREALVLRGAGHTTEGIAKMLGTTKKAVEMMIRNERNRQNKETG